jgi:hypothetical protein
MVDNKAGFVGEFQSDKMLVGWADIAQYLDYKFSIRTLQRYNEKKPLKRTFINRKTFHSKASDINNWIKRLGLR